MKAFLQELAEIVYRQHASSLSEVTIVFPNRRAVLYFRKYLSELLSKPAFSPALVTIEDFIGSFSVLKVPDKLELIYQLQRVYNEVVRSHAPAEELGGMDQFYFWGDMLLR